MLAWLKKQWKFVLVAVACVAAYVVGLLSKGVGKKFSAPVQGPDLEKENLKLELEKEKLDSAAKEKKHEIAEDHKREVDEAVTEITCVTDKLTDIEKIRQYAVDTGGIVHSK